MKIQNFNEYANIFYNSWKNAITTKKREKDFNGNNWVHKRTLETLGIAKYFNFDKKDSCTLSNAQKITANLLGINNFQELLKIKKSNTDEFKLYITILSNCTNKASYLLWKYYSEIINLSYSTASFEKKLKIANSYFPSLPKQKKRKTRFTKSYVDDVPNGAEFDADYHMFD